MDENLLQDVVAQALKAGADAAEAVFAERQALSVSVRMGELEEVEREEARDLGLCVFIGRRQATVSGSDISALARAKLIERAVAMARLAPEDPYAGLAPEDRLARGPFPDLDLYDATEPDAEGLEAQARESEEAARAIEGVTNSDGGSASWSTGSWTLVTSTGYHANLAVVAALTDPDTLVVSDAHVHASLIDGCRLARAEVVVVPHNDVAAVEVALAGRSHPRALVLTESIFSVLGDAAPVAELTEVCRRHDALLVVDEAHAIGVRGPLGGGLCAEAGVQEHIVATLTLSKALGSQGGAVLCSPAIRDHLVNRARPFIYDTGLAPAAVGAADAALSMLVDEPERTSRVRQVAGVLADACGVAVPAGAVLAVPMPGPREAVAAVEVAADRGVRIGCFRPPSTPDGISRLRLTAHADLDEARLQQACTVLKDVSR